MFARMNANVCQFNKTTEPKQHIHVSTGIIVAAPLVEQPMNHPISVCRDVIVAV
jgi:hypothetical protein